MKMIGEFKCNTNSCAASKDVWEHFGQIDEYIINRLITKYKNKHDDLLLYVLGQNPKSTFFINFKKCRG